MASRTFSHRLDGETLVRQRGGLLSKWCMFVDDAETATFRVVLMLVCVTTKDCVKRISGPFAPPACDGAGDTKRTIYGRWKCLLLRRKSEEPTVGGNLK